MTGEKTSNEIDNEYDQKINILIQFLEPFRLNGQFHLSEAYLEPTSCMFKKMSKLIPDYKSKIKPQLDNLGKMKDMVLDEIMWYAEYWTIVSGDFRFLQYILEDERYNITVFHLLQLWEVFNNLFKSVDLENDQEWISIKKNELFDKDFPSEIESNDIIDLHPQYNMTSSDIRNIFLQAITIFRNHFPNCLLIN